MSQRSVLFALPLLLLFACSRPEVKVPEDVIPREKMISVMVDIHLEEAAFQLRNFNDGRTPIIDAHGRYRYVFNKHKITEDQFRKSFAFYNRQPAYFHDMYADIITRLSEAQAESRR